MRKKELGVQDYPLGEKHPDLIKSKNGMKPSDLTLQNISLGSVKIDDFQISEETLNYQAQISYSSDREPLGKNLERAAEMVKIPNEVIMEIYEKLRPGRSKNKAELLSYAKLLKDKYKAKILSAFILEAAEVYEKRGLYKSRY